MRTLSTLSACPGAAGPRPGDTFKRLLDHARIYAARAALGFELGLKLPLLQRASKRLWRRQAQIIQPCQRASRTIAPVSPDEKSLFSGKVPPMSVCEESV